MQRFLAVVGLLTGLSTSSLQARTWTDRFGRQFEAEVVEVAAEEVIFQFPNGNRFTIKLAELSEADRSQLRAPRRATLQDGRPVAGPRTGNFGRPWPSAERFDGRSRVEEVSADREAGYVYESENYRFVSELRLGDEVMRNFSVMFETCYRYCQQLPLSLESSGGGRQKVLLFADEARYYQAGGPPGSAGCYSPGNDLVLTPLSSLGVVAFSGTTRLDRERQNKVLIHEIVHQLTPQSYYGGGRNGWFTEGLADYVATTPYSWGYFQSDPHGRAVKEYVSGYGLKGLGGRGLGERIELPPLREFLSMPYSRFAGGDARRNYGAGLLLVHYFFHADGQGKARRISEFLRRLDAGQSPTKAHEALLDGRSWEQLEEEVAASWRSKGITLVFGG